MMKERVLGVATASLALASAASLNSHVYAEQSMPSFTDLPKIEPLHITTGTLYERPLDLSVLLPYDELEDTVRTLASLIDESSTTFKDVIQRDAFKYDFSKPAVYELTAYTLMPEENGWFGTISSAQYELKGKYLADRYIAVDPTVIPYHTKVYIEFPEHRRYVEQHGEIVDLNGEYLAVDCGGAIKNNRIDLFVGGQTQYYEDIANQIGRGDVNVYYPMKEKEVVE